MKTFLFGFKSSSLWLRQKNHCRWPRKSLSLIFHENFPFGGMEITATYRWFWYKPWTNEVTDFPRANASTRGNSAAFLRVRSPYTFCRCVCNNMTIDLDPTGSGHVSMVCYKPWTSEVTDFPRANARTRGKSAAFPRVRSPYTLHRYVCINTAVEFDRTWRMAFTLDSYLFALRMNAFATRTPSLVTIEACVYSCSNLYWALGQNLRGSYPTVSIESGIDRW